MFNEQFSMLNWVNLQMLKLISFLIVVTSLAWTSCKSPEKKPIKKYISTASLIRAQVKHVDTSLYSIVKVVTTDSLHSDTSYIRREDFEAEAKEFLELPDLGDPKVAKHFTESTLYDQEINRVIITYVPDDPNKQLVRKEEVLITPGTANGDQITSIVINKVVSNRDSLVEKNMLWQMDKSFQIATTRQLPGQTEINTVTRVIWNGDYRQ